MIVFNCRCGETFQVADSAVGNLLTCAKCGQLVAVPNLQIKRHWTKRWEAILLASVCGLYLAFFWIPFTLQGGWSQPDGFAVLGSSFFCFPSVFCIVFLIFYGIMLAVHWRY